MLNRLKKSLTDPATLIHVRQNGVYCETVHYTREGLAVRDVSFSYQNCVFTFTLTEDSKIIAGEWRAL
ncbi:hypothetical protein [Pectobacterium phage Wc4-1]|uniref:Uncharacterized protein n=1 Tax=Pectobacterium phage Wc4 TaxID=2652428 RepID=A0A5P8D400_9CAUD|nr:hypothetical protein [Pectobacterium phage Wc4]QFP93931.1 hypothetical protein [Pectobacterium phage Wc4-1]